MTCAEFALLVEQYRGQQERLDRRAAMSAWLLANINRDSKTRPEPFALDEVVEWLGHGFARRVPLSMPQPPEVLHERLSLLQAFYSDNGQTQ